MRGRVTAVHAAKKKKANQKRDFEVTQFRIADYADVDAVIALSEGRIQDITFKDATLLFNRISLDGSAYAKYTVVEHLMKTCLELQDVELDSIRQNVQVQPGGIISAQQFHAVLQKPTIKTLLEQAFKDKLNRRDMASDGTILVDRSFLQQKIAWRVDRDDAFGTLPLTCFYLLVFMILVVYHLQIWRRQELERGIEHWIYNQGEFYYGPFISEHVYSRDSFAHWLDVSGLPGIFSNTRDSAGSVEVRMDNTNIIVGDVYLRQLTGDEYSEKSAWLLSNVNATKYIDDHASSSGRYLGAARLTVQHLFAPSTGWVSDDTKELSLVFHTYNNQAEMFAKTEIRVRLDMFGHVKPIVKARAVIIYPYPIAVIYAADVLYILIILFMLWTELKDMCSACVLGFGEFLDYWTVWNAIDWSSMVLGFVNIALWICGCMAMQADSLHGLLDSSGRMSLNAISISASQMESMHSDLDRIHALCVALHLTVAATAVFIVLKFFKGFQANPRLQTVTATLAFVSTDLYHFLVVFMAVFASFATIGHVLFGGDITKFYTLASSFNTGVTVLMGEFDWYSELSDKPALLPSGMPRLLLIIWFACYMTFVLLIMVNMLLAMILERYSEVSEALSTRSDARTIWSQTARYLTRKFQTRGFMPLYRIRRQLENDDDPAHPDKVVTEDSLREAFPGMGEEQAAYIMSFLEAELYDELMALQEDEGEARAKRTERFVQSITEELHVISSMVLENNDRLREIENSFRTTGFRTPKARAGAAVALMKEAADDDTNENDKPVKAYKENLQIKGLDVEDADDRMVKTFFQLRCSNENGKEATCCM